MARDDISYNDWLATVKAYAQEEGRPFASVAEHYSFQSAYEEGMGMLEAWTDACNWLDA